LIEVTEFVSLAAAVTPVVAMGNVARRTLERRLTMILRERTAYRVPLIGAALIGLSLLAVLPGWSGGQDATPLPDRVPTSAPTNFDEPRSDAAPAALPGLTPGPGGGLPAASTAEVTPSNNAPLGLPNPLAGPAGGEPDRIGALEAKLAQLLQDVQALRAGMATQGPRPATSADSVFVVRPAEGQPGDYQTSQQPRPSPTYHPQSMTMTTTRLYTTYREDDVVTLTRAKYKLPAGAADALATIIKDYVKKDIEARVEGETLTVIASEEDQARVRAFVVLLREDANSPATGNLPNHGTPGKPANKTSNGNNDPFSRSVGETR
jgi:hypothetical protein